MRIKLALLGVTTLCVLTTGCIYTDRSSQYQRSGSLPSIVLPADVDSTPLEPLYPIPPVATRMDAFLETDIGGDSVPRPEPMSAEREAAKVKIQKVGGRQWLLIDAPASQVWPLAQSYLSEIGIGVHKSDAAKGLIETNWVQFKLDNTTETHYRIRIEKGVRVETTEVHILQQQTPLGGDKTASWPNVSTNAEREAWLLEGLANSLAQSIGNKAASLLGQSVGGESKAELAMHNDEPALIMRLDRERAWATLAHGLQTDGFIRWEENDNYGLFYFQFTGNYVRPNWFMRMFSWRNRKPVEKKPYSLDVVLQHLADTPEARTLMAGNVNAGFNGELPKGAGYLLVVTHDGEKWVARARDYKGERLEPEQNKKLLAMLRRGLI